MPVRLFVHVNRPLLTMVIAVDGPVVNNLLWVIEISATLLIKLAAVVVLTPVFVVPGILVSMLGGWCGQIYMRAQLSVKREMSNAKAPVMGHFGAAIAGLSTHFMPSSQCLSSLICIHSFDTCLRCSGCVPAGILSTH